MNHDVSIQVSHGYDTIIVTESVNRSLAAISDTLNNDPDPLPPIEVDIWVNGVISESRGFSAVKSEIPQIEAYLNSLIFRA